MISEATCQKSFFIGVNEYTYEETLRAHPFVENQNIKKSAKT